MFGNQMSQLPYNPLMLSQMMAQPFNMTQTSSFVQPQFMLPYGYPSNLVSNGATFGHPLAIELLKLRMAAFSQSQMQQTMMPAYRPIPQSNLVPVTTEARKGLELPVVQNTTTTVPQTTEITPKIECLHLANEDSDPSATSADADTESVGSVEKVSSSKKIKKQNTCGHHDKPHYARGLCNNCYHKHGRTKKPWLCSHEKLYAHGLCQKCYKKASRKNLLTDTMKSQIKKLQVYAIYGPKSEAS